MCCRRGGGPWGGVPAPCWVPLRRRNGRPAAGTMRPLVAFFSSTAVPSSSFLWNGDDILQIYKKEYKDEEGIPMKPLLFWDGGVRVPIRKV